MDLTQIMLFWPQSESSRNLRSDPIDEYPLWYSQMQ